MSHLPSCEHVDRGVATGGRRGTALGHDPGQAVLDGHARGGKFDRLDGDFHLRPRLCFEEGGVLVFDGLAAFEDSAAIVGQSAVCGPQGGHRLGIAAVERLDEGVGRGPNGRVRPMCRRLSTARRCGTPEPQVQTNKITGTSRSPRNAAGVDGANVWKFIVRFSES